MAKKEEQVKVPEIIDNVDALIAKMDAMREAQREFATFTQEQVDKIFYEAASAANKMRLQMCIRDRMYTRYSVLIRSFREEYWKVSFFIHLRSFL